MIMIKVAKSFHLHIITLIELELLLVRIFSGVGLFA